MVQAMGSLSNGDPVSVAGMAPAVVASPVRRRMVVGTDPAPLRLTGGFRADVSLGEKVRTLSLIGSGVTDYLDPLFEPEASLNGMKLTLEYIARMSSRWDVCDWQELRPRSALLIGAAAPGTARIQIDDWSTCPVLRLPRSMEDLLSTIDPKFRVDLRRAGNRLSRSGEVRFELATAPRPWTSSYRPSSACTRRAGRCETSLACPERRRCRNFIVRLRRSSSKRAGSGFTASDWMAA